MHVRIAWEIYQHQQKGGGIDGVSKGSGSSASSTSASSSSKAVPPPSSVGNIVGLSTPSSSSASSGPSTSLAADILRASNIPFPGLGRPGEAPPPHFTAPMLSPHAHPSHASPRGTAYDPLFLNSAASHLGVISINENCSKGFNSMTSFLFIYLFILILNNVFRPAAS